MKTISARLSAIEGAIRAHLEGDGADGWAASRIAAKTPFDWDAYRAAKVAERVGSGRYDDAAAAAGTTTAEFVEDLDERLDARLAAEVPGDPQPPEPGRRQGFDWAKYARLKELDARRRDLEAAELQALT